MSELGKQVNKYSVEALLDLDATAIAKKIKKGHLTSEFITKTYISHIKKTQPDINALVEERFEDALKEAISCDLETDPHIKNKPLFGVPISIKESFDVKGMHTTGGIAHRKDIILNEDAYAVEKLKDAGAIILGKTNTPELCFCQETDNKLFGRTNNPWNLERTAGGSSGGEGALLATGASALGLAADVGGSIRFPSHFNGVVGFKPGAQDVNDEGLFPKIDIPLQNRMLGVGPMGKSVRDMKLVYQLLRSETESKQLFEKLELHFLISDSIYPLSKDSKLLINQLKNHLSKNYVVEETVPPYFDDTAQIWQEIMSIDGAKSVRQIAYNTDRVNVIKNFIQEKITRNTPVHSYLSWALIGANMFKPTTKRLQEIEGTIKQGDQAIDRYLMNKLLILPVYHTSALKHGEVFSELFSIQKTFLKYIPYTAYANVWGLPSLTLPIGLDNEGLPVAVQIIGRKGNEDAIFRTGEFIEANFYAYKRAKSE